MVVGGYQFATTYTVARVCASRATGWPSIFPSARRRVRVENLKRTDRRLQFDLLRGGAVVGFDGEMVAEDAITGSVVMGEQRGTFQLVRLVAVRTDLLAEYDGKLSARRRRDHLRHTRAFRCFGGLSFETYPTSRFGRLYASSETDLLRRARQSRPVPGRDPGRVRPR
jgi:hypothetical protein